LDDVISWRNWFQSFGAMSRKDRSVNFSLELMGGRMRAGVGQEVERVRPGGWSASWLRRYDGLDVTMVLKVMEMTLYWMR
jgi:hypothetical protein